LFIFAQLPRSQQRSTHHQCDRTAAWGVQAPDQKTQTLPPQAETAAMLFWALLASDQINRLKVDGRQTLSATTIGSQSTSPSELRRHAAWRLRQSDSNIKVDRS